MRVTVCELPHEPQALAAAWSALSEHTSEHASELVLLPEFAWVEPVWQAERFDAVRWAAAMARSEAWLPRLAELGAAHVVGTRPVTIEGRRFNQGYLWSASGAVVPLRSKFNLPLEPGWWEGCWFEPGDAAFPAFQAGELSFGLNICTELWALDTFAAYGTMDIQAILSPRATGASTTVKWLSVGVVAAVRSGAFSLSSNRVEPSGASGGVGWIIGPDGRILAATSRDAPFATLDIDLAASARAKDEYPNYVFKGSLVVGH
jgi:N-carbamoylputrescine amidase